MSTTLNQSLRSIKTFVMRKGRMTEGQKKAYETFSAAWCVPYTGEPLDFPALFGNENSVIMEIGFGMGDATVEIAAQNPEVNYLGIEVYQAGVGKLLSEIERCGLKNIRIIEHDALEVLDTMIPAVSLAGFHVFFPDPWQKKKHHKRRLMHRPHTDLMASKLRKDGFVYMVTDWEAYADDAFAELSETPLLVSKYERFASPQQWRPRTKFEQKGMKKSHVIRELLFVRKGNMEIIGKNNDT